MRQDTPAATPALPDIASARHASRCCGSRASRLRTPIAAFRSPTRCDRSPPPPLASRSLRSRSADISFVVITGVSALVAWVLAKMFKLKKSQTAFAICAAMFQNSNSLPIALVQSLVGVVPGLKWGKSDTKDAMLGRALTYLVLYSTLGMVLRWSYGVKLLASADDEEPVLPLSSEPENHGQNVIVAPAPTTTAGRPVNVLSPEPIGREDPFNSLEALAASNRASVTIPRGSLIGRGRSMSGDSEPRPASLPMSPSPLGRSPRGFSPAGPRQRRGSALSRSSSRSRPLPSRTDSGRDFWNLPEQPRRNELVDLAEDSSESEAEDADEWGGPEMPLLRRRLSPSASLLRRAAVRARAIVASSWEAFYAFMTVPTWAALISIFIALIPPLQAFVKDIHPFVAAVKSAGQCSIPVTLVVLGAFFYTPPPAVQLPDEIDHTLKKYIERKIRALTTREKSAYEGENRAVFVAVVSRMILVPLFFLPVIAYIARTDPFPAAADPVFILCSVLLVSSPPALTLAQLTQAASGDAFERLISKTISWSYAVLTPPLTIAYVVIGLVFSKL